MTTTLWSPHNSGLHGYDGDMAFSSLPLSLSVDDDDVWLSTDVCSLTSVDVVQPQLSTFHTFSTSTLSTWSSHSTQPHHAVLDDQHVTTSKTDDTSWSTTSANADVQTSEVDERCWFNGDGMMSSNDLHKCLSHLLMTSQHGCHGNDNKVTADSQSEPSDVRLLADKRQPSQYDGDRLCLVTTASRSDEKYLLNTSQTTDVRSSTLSYDAVNIDHGRLDHFSTGFLLLVQ